MPLRLGTAARNAAASGICDQVDGGSGAGVLRVYTGTQPATPATSPTGTLLAEFTLSDPAFGAPATGVKTLDVTPALTDIALATGTAGWCRFCDSTEAAGTGLGVMDGDVTATGGGGLVTFDSVSFTVGATIEVTGGTLTMPAS